MFVYHTPISMFTSASFSKWVSFRISSVIAALIKAIGSFFLRCQVATLTEDTANFSVIPELHLKSHKISHRFVLSFKRRLEGRGKAQTIEKGWRKDDYKTLFSIDWCIFFAYSLDWPFNSNNQRSQLDRVMPTGAFATMFYFLFVCFFFCFSFFLFCYFTHHWLFAGCGKYFVQWIRWHESSGSQFECKRLMFLVRCSSSGYLVNNSGIQFLASSLQLTMKRTDHTSDKSFLFLSIYRLALRPMSFALYHFMSSI